MGSPRSPDEPRGGVVIRRAVEADRPILAEFAAPLQRRPDRHVTYLGFEPGSIAAELVEEDVDWTAVSAVAETDGRLNGWLMGSVDAAMGRVWWFGPFVDADAAAWAEFADALYDHARARLPEGTAEEELAPDARFVTLAEWAVGRGFHPDPGSAVLALDHPLERPPGEFRPVGADDDGVVRLHDELFPGTHTTGAVLVGGVDDRHVRLVLEHDGDVAGYVAVERQPGGEGYIDYLGVDPRFRRRGFGADLVRAGVAALTELGCTSFHLTVREANVAARTLYAGLGFVEERVIHPYRRGFDVP